MNFHCIKCYVSQVLGAQLLTSVILGLGRLKSQGWWFEASPGK
jgi:hypothetical protein